MGGDGNDVLAANEMVGGPGEDGLGFDIGGTVAAYGGDGNDRIGIDDYHFESGTTPDTAECGPGTDRVWANPDDTVAVNDTARCGAGYIDVARVDSRAEALVPNSRCETFEFDHKATGVLERSDTDLVIEDTPTHLITDKSGARYGLSSETVDLSAYEGRRVTVSGWVETSRPEYGGRMDVERVEER